MNCTDCTDQLDDYVDGELRPRDARALEAHLVMCPSCRAQLDSLNTLLAESKRLPCAIAPRPDLWSELKAQLEERHSNAQTRRSPVADDAPRAIGFFQPPIRLRLLQWTASLAVAGMAIIFGMLAESRIEPRAPGWTVTAVEGAPRVGSRALRNEGMFRIGQWLETDATSRARVEVGSIGEVSVEPNSRLRLTGVAETDHRLELARGTVSAFILAPPRLFFVDTPSATAVDLGCAYTLSVDDHGDGELHVSSGFVALENGGRESIIPLGAMCLTRRGHGPGTPFVEDAPAALRRALARFDFEPGAASTALQEVLRQARRDDGVTLWHLLARTSGADRALVFDELARHVPPPPAVTREGILGGSPAMLRAWAAELGLDRF